MKKEYEHIILGGGASGLMTASLLREPSNTLLIEGNAAVGAKIAVSGGGRCNITNARVEPEDYVAEGDFVRQVLTSFDQKALLVWLADRGVVPVLQKESQYFCATSAREILELFSREVRHTDVRTSSRIKAVRKVRDVFEIRTDNGVFFSRRLIVATGGLSFPKLGASDIGYRIAEVFGHTIVPPTPALVGLTLQPEQFFLKELSGLSTEVVITLADKRIRNRLLFAHKGISGPAVLDASLYWRKGQIEIDFIPDVDLADLRRSSKQISTLLPLPKRLARALLTHLGMKDMPGNRMSARAWEQLERLHHYRFAPAGTFGYSKAEVTRGGVDVTGIYPETMESRREPGLYFIGEVLDVTGRLGGYNLQWAFSSAAACAGAINRFNANMV